MKRWKDHIHNVIHNEVTAEGTFIFISVVMGILTGVMASTFHILVEKLVHVAGTHESMNLQSFIIGLGFIFTSGYLSTRYFPNTFGSGIPYVKLALAAYKGRIEWFQPFTKFFTTLFTLASGMSLGKEGPMVSVSSGLGSLLGKILRLDPKRRKQLVAIGASGGLAAAFNTPIAAMIFTVEEIVGDLDSKLMGPIIISSVVASITSVKILGGHSTFDHLQYSYNYQNEIFFYAFIGICSALVGSLFVKSILGLRSLNKTIFHHHKLTIIMLTFCVLAAISQFRPEILGDGVTMINKILNGDLAELSFISQILIIKFIVCIFCISCGASGGIFMPVLFIGASLGATIGLALNYLYPGSNAPIGVCAIIGMASFLVSVIRAPFTAIIMVFEMTQDYNIILPIMISSSFAYIFSEFLMKGSIYENISKQDHMSLPEKGDNEVLSELIIEEAMWRDVKAIAASTSVKEAYEDVNSLPYHGFPVLSSTNELMGMISKSQLLEKSKHKTDQLQPVGRFCNKDVITVYADQSLMVAFHKLKRYRISRLPVVSRINDRHVIGIIGAEDIVNHFGYRINYDSQMKEKSEDSEESN